MISVTSFLVHIAGPMQDGVQKCSRCGEVLADYRNAMVMEGECPDALSGWKVSGWRQGAFVASAGPCSVVLDHDASEADEIACGGLLQ